MKRLALAAGRRKRDLPGTPPPSKNFTRACPVIELLPRMPTFGLGPRPDEPYRAWQHDPLWTVLTAEKGFQRRPHCLLLLFGCVLCGPRYRSETKRKARRLRCPSRPGKQHGWFMRRQ